MQDPVEFIPEHDLTRPVAGRHNLMRQYELVDRVRRYNPQTDEVALNRAYVYAMKAHGAQIRASGDPYFSHPLEVAAILTDMKLDDATIVAAVLHDTIEDTDSTREEIDKLFGSDIGRLVDGLTKLKKLDLVSKRASKRKISVSCSWPWLKTFACFSSSSPTACIICARYISWRRTSGRGSPRKPSISMRRSPATGHAEMRDELDDLAFRHLMPDAYAMIAARLDDLRRKNGKIIVTIEKELTSGLAARGIDAKVEGRQKQPYSVWRKMERKSIAFEQLPDIFGFRVIVEDLDDCYRVIGVVHTKWAVVPGRFKDYISTPKQNDYQSIHTTVVGPGRQRAELQVRTALMHDIARNGIAAHALYKDGRIKGKERLTSESRSYQWLRRTVALLAEGATPEEFLEHTKLELFHDQVFCFTPNGRLIALPRGATPVDFAYAVHTDVGNSAVGAKINGRHAPLLSELQNGDEVEIARAEGQTPPAAWEGLVMTGKARAAIRRATRDAVRAQYAALGRQIVTRAFERAGKAFTEDKLKSALPRLARTTIEDVLAAVGRGEMFSGDVVRAVYPEFMEERKPIVPRARGEAGWFGMKKAASLRLQDPRWRQAKPERNPHSWLARRFAGPLRPERWRGAWRSYRRHSDPWRGNHHLSDPIFRSYRLR